MNAMSEGYATDYAIQLAKIICANPSSKAELNKESAKNLVDFIQAVADGLHSGNLVK